jgi:hypothetical protein
LLGQGLDDVALRGRLEKADQHRALLKEGDLLGVRRLDLEHGIRTLQQIRSAGDELCPGRLVRLVGEERPGSGARLDLDFELGGDQLGGRVRDERHPALL